MMTIKGSEPRGGSPATAVTPPAGSPAGTLSRRQRFLSACQCHPLDYPPVWLMRQAGRALPEYRTLKERHCFLELVQTPELAAEVTLQPIRRFGFDAAILFSDILVAAEAMGQAYRFREQGGIEMEFVVRSAEDIDKLEPGAVRERLDYVARALQLIRRELAGSTALLGFAGSPWTLANFMMEGGSAKEHTKARALFYSDPELFNRLLSKVTAAVTELLRLQIEAGADAVQIFDSLGGEAAGQIYEAASACWIRQIITALEGRVPVIVFGRGVHGSWETLRRTGAQVLGVDWSIPLESVREGVPPDIGLQGNLDPLVLTTTPSQVAGQTRAILESMRGRPGHIFNLGHGVPPSAKLECIESLVTTVRDFQ